MIRWSLLVAMATVACASNPPDVRRVHDVDASTAIADAAIDAEAADVTTPDAWASSTRRATLPLMVAGDVECRGKKCRAGEEVCCTGECKPVAEVRAGEVAASIAAACGPDVRGVEYGDRIKACETSTECASNAICCPVYLESDRKGHVSDEILSVYMCTDDPVRDCTGVELCDGTSCRTPRPTRALACAGKTCSGATPHCSYAGADPSKTPPVWPKIAPACLGVDVMRGTRDMIVRCISHRDCPGPLPEHQGIGAQCILNRTSGETSCLYNLGPITPLAYATPTCESDGDCRALWPRWTTLAGGDPAKPPPIKCIPRPGDPARRRECAMPWRNQPRR